MKILVSALRGDEKGALMLKPDGRPFAGGKFARRAYRKGTNRFKRGGAYVINGPDGMPIQLPAITK